MSTGQLTPEETTEILGKVYEANLKFWEQEKVTNPVEMAIKDVENMATDPFSPRGKGLDITARNNWVTEKRNNG